MKKLFLSFAVGLLALSVVDKKIVHHPELIECAGRLILIAPDKGRNKKDNNVKPR